MSILIIKKGGRKGGRERGREEGKISYSRMPTNKYRSDGIRKSLVDQESSIDAKTSEWKCDEG